MGDPSSPVPLSDSERLDRLEKMLRYALDRLDALDLRTMGRSDAPPPPADPNIALLKNAMLAMFKSVAGYPYAFDGAKDAMALKRLLKMGDQPAVLQRWRANLALGDRFPGTRSIAMFASRFNNYAPGKPATKLVATREDPYR